MNRAGVIILSTLGAATGLAGIGLLGYAGRRYWQASRRPRERVGAPIEIGAPSDFHHVDGFHLRSSQAQASGETGMLPPPSPGAPPVPFPRRVRRPADPEGAPQATSWPNCRRQPGPASTRPPKTPCLQRPKYRLPQPKISFPSARRQLISQPRAAHPFRSQEPYSIKAPPSPPCHAQPKARDTDASFIIANSPTKSSVGTKFGSPFDALGWPDGQKGRIAARSNAWVCLPGNLATPDGRPRRGAHTGGVRLSRTLARFSDSAL